MTAAPTAVPEINAGVRTPRSDGFVRVLSAGVSGVMLAVTVLVCAQVRTDLRRSRLSPPRWRREPRCSTQARRLRGRTLYPPTPGSAFVRSATSPARCRRFPLPAHGIRRR